MPDTVETIVLNGGNKLESIYPCINIKSITIPDSITAINENAFWMCSNLKTIYTTKKNKKLGKKALKVSKIKAKIIIN